MRKDPKTKPIISGLKYCIRILLWRPREPAIFSIKQETQIPELGGFPKNESITPASPIKAPVSINLRTATCNLPLKVIDLFSVFLYEFIIRVSFYLLFNFYNSLFYSYI